ncbi:ATP-binding protein [Nocardioides KLBMP 9356]|uniref:ATP-binding protein n=1 Tax=Nocardioides potassii TaxID=2911371 RepID=A0ABS9HF89_9ACTN|nr:AAA family ATPase [Nocardioides potassii]MCF6379209.1 ATP-binding protein [Nocardioides potassii]
MRAFVLVGGWPGSGKTTLAGDLATELDLPLLSKDEVKEALMDALGAPASVKESRELGRAAVFALLRAARGCPGAVIDSTWFDYSEPLARALPGPVIEVRCRVPVDVARTRYRARRRDPRHLDDERDELELWGDEVAPLDMGPLIEVDTTEPVDLRALAARIRDEIGRRSSLTEDCQ